MTADPLRGQNSYALPEGPTRSSMHTVKLLLDPRPIKSATESEAEPREMEAILTDAALVMLDKMLGGVFRRADRAYRENVVNRVKALDGSTRALLQMAKAMLVAKASGEDQVAAMERALGWERLKELVAETEIAVTNTREDNLIEIDERYPTVRRMIPVLLNAFVFRSWKSNDSLLDALDLLLGLHADRRGHLPQRPPTAFPKSTWRKLVGKGSKFDRRAYDDATRLFAIRWHLGRRQSCVPSLRRFSSAFGGICHTSPTRGIGIGCPGSLRCLACRANRFA